MVPNFLVGSFVINIFPWSLFYASFCIQDKQGRKRPKIRIKRRKERLREVERERQTEREGETETDRKIKRDQIQFNFTINSPDSLSLGSEERYPNYGIMLGIRPR